MLHVSDLNKTSLKKVNSNKKIYNTLLEKCYSQIKQKNENMITNMIYILPPFGLGLPLYNMDHAMLYIMRKLDKGGFYIRLCSQNKLYIDWNKNVVKPTQDKTKSKVSFM
tara:strand:+ start:8991 stop:9320 length:330 start_codon:yes stop_codon:yes gene_type:complete